jgi:Ribonuclease G/E
MAKAGDRKALERALKSAFARDPEPIRLFPIAPSGLVELTRRRRRPPLHEVLMYPVGELGRTWVRRPQVIAFAALRALRKARADNAGAAPLIAAAAPVVTALVSGEAAAARLALEERWGRGIEVAEQSDLQTFELRRA